MATQMTTKYRGAFALALHYDMVPTGGTQTLYSDLEELGWYWSEAAQAWLLLDNIRQYTAALEVAFDLQLTLPRDTVNNRAMLYRQLNEMGYTFNGDEWVEVMR